MSPIEDPPLTDNHRVADHLAAVWRTAAKVLRNMGETVNTANMHVMFEEAAKLMRPMAPHITPKTRSVEEHLTDSWQIAKNAIASVNEKPSGANMHIFVEEASKALTRSNQADHQHV